MLRSGVFIAALGLALGTAQAQQGATRRSLRRHRSRLGPPRRSRRRQLPRRGDTAGWRGTPSDEEGARRGAEAFRAGREGHRPQQHSGGDGLFVKAAELNPEEPKYAYADQIARQHLVTDLIQQSDKDKILGHFADRARKGRGSVRHRSGEPDGGAAYGRAGVGNGGRRAGGAFGGDRRAPPIALEPKAGVRSFHIRGSERNVISQVLPAYGIQPTIDDSVGSQGVRYDVDDADFATAERTLALVTGTFFVPLDPARALVAKDTRANHDKYEREAVETVYLPGMAADQITEITNIAKNVFTLRTASADVDQSALTVRGPTADLNALNKTLTTLLEGRSELQLDVRLYEIDRTKAVNLGRSCPTRRPFSMCIPRHATF